jgi:putative tryptophan/tyrosine transport system substrate-binding protein
MQRRDFIRIVPALAVAWPFEALAQQPTSMRRIAVLMGFPDGDPRGQAYVLAMRQKLQSLGWVEGRNLRIDYRWAGGDPEKTRTFARELIGTNPAVIVTSTNQVTETVRRETQTIPIVFASLGDPVGSGLVASLARPGGNVTGFPVFVEAMGGKWLELMKEIAQRVERVGFIFHPDPAPHRGLLRAAQSAAPSLNIKLFPLAVHDRNEIAAAITGFASEANGGLAVGTHAVTLSNRELLNSLAVNHRLPTVFGDAVWTESGGLLSYGSDIVDLFRGAASYVDLILKGANPADLPVQLPTRFELTINLKTARALGLSVPAILLDRADKLIE